MLDLPFPCKIFRVHCAWCREVVGHLIMDENTSETGARNRAQSTFKTDEIHNLSCENERRIKALIATKNKYDFTVELI